MALFYNPFLFYYPFFLLPFISLLFLPSPPIPVLVAEVCSVPGDSAQLLSVAAQRLRRELQLMGRSKENNKERINLLTINN